MRLGGFTLVEILVVTALTGLLAAMVLPVLAQSKGAAYRTASLANVKGIALAQFLYMDDYDGSIAMNRDCTLVIEGRGDQAPCVEGRAYRGWVDLTVPYVRDYAVFKSPADPLAAVPLSPDARDGAGRPLRQGVMWADRSDGRPRGGDRRSSYARNNNWANNGTYTARSVEATSPATLVLVYSFAANSGAGARGAMEGTPGASFTVVRRPDVFPSACVAYGPTTEGNSRSNFLDLLPPAARAFEAVRPSSERYGGRGVYAFADGHAKALPPEAIRGQCGWGTGAGGVETGNDGTHPDFRF